MKILPHLKKKDSNLLPSCNSQWWQIAFFKNGCSNIFHLMQGELPMPPWRGETSVPSSCLWASLSHPWNSRMWEQRCCLTLKVKSGRSLTSARSSCGVYASEAPSQVVPLRIQPYEGPRGRVQSTFPGESESSRLSSWGSRCRGAEKTSPLCPV